MKRVSSILLSCLLAAAVGTAQTSDELLSMAQAALQGQNFERAIQILEPLTRRAPENPRAWLLYGLALQRSGDLEGSLDAHLKATTFEETHVRGMYNLARAYAAMGDGDKAFEWLERLKQTGDFNLTGIALDPDLESLKDDPRFQSLLPKPEDFANPFDEPAKIIREWVGEAEGDAFGWIARNIGDVDDDGIADVTTSAPNKNLGGANAGRAYVYSGKSGELLWTQSGEPGDQLGLGIEAAGDTNADGIPDVVVGAPGGGKTFVYSGRDGKVLLALEEKQEGEGFGRKTTDAGDVDGDGHDDVLVGAPLNDEKGENAGRAAVYSGKDGTELIAWYGADAGDQFGSAAGAGVVSGRKVFVVGAPNAGAGGRAYVYAGAKGELSFVIDSDEDDAQLGGMFVSIVGDVDADGYPDVYASDWASNVNGRGSGRIYVHSGNPERKGARLFSLSGEAAGDGFGIGPADAGDVDGDGHDDLVIGAWQHGGSAPSGGKVYLYSGKTRELLRVWTGRVPGDTFGFDATGMGDVDGDGTIDLLLTSAWSSINGARSGRMYIVSGK